MAAELETHEKKPQLDPVNYRKAFFSSAVAGAAFGVIFSILFTFLAQAPWPPLFFIPTVALSAGLLSGVAGLGGTYLDLRLLQMGITKPQLRAIISFGAVALITFSISYSGAVAAGIISFDQKVQHYLLWGALAGIAFGAVFALITYRSDRMRQKMELLELENRHLAELASREELLREAARNLAVAEERNRMARELHDSISQGMHGIVYSLRTLRSIVQDNEKGLLILGHLEETAAGTLKELRHLVVELSPSPLEDHGLVEALRLHSDLFARRQQIELELHLDYNGALQPEQEAALYRIAQEALTNIQKHAAATRVSLTLQQEGSAFVLTVRDNGRGFAPDSSAGGHGLSNMETRARQNGGTLQVTSSPGVGTVVTAYFPAAD